jgi:threonyl-tRNA synthetase
MCENEKCSEIYKIRHSLAHVLAQAVMEIYPGTELGFGPPVENGFYYDFRFPGEAPGAEDLKAIEKKMKHIIKQNQEFSSYTLSADEAIKFLNETNQVLKAEYAQELLDKGYELSFYRNGNFIDMCEGNHVNKTKDLPVNAFMLDSIAGSYWRGDSDRPMLTRIYGLAFETKEQLQEFLTERKLARERDHRKLGRELDIFVIDDEIGAGLPLWLPNGTVLRDEIEKLAKDTEFQLGYDRVATPHITKENLFYTSGHLPYYKDTMYAPIEIDGENYYLKPMNCPFHHKVFSSRLRSYRELPLRLAEYGTCYRYEHSGALSGLLRVRCLSMNDAHIYCTPEQVRSEFKQVLEMHRNFYELFRIKKFWIRLSLHAKNSGKFIDNEDKWLFCEKIVQECLEETGFDYKTEEGEAAFYGPKADFQIRNVIGREETASTTQLDFAMPARFNLRYTAEDGSQQEPYIIHRAPLGTHERFIAFLIEHFGGAFPTWMAPIQIRLVPVADTFMDYAKRIKDLFHKEGFRIQIDESNDSFGKKIRNAIVHKIPNILILGEAEKNNNTVTWRRYAVQEQKNLPVANLLEIMQKMRKERIMDNFADTELPDTE